MLARVIKNTVRLRLRIKMEEIQVPSEEAYKQELANFFNLVLGKDPASNRLNFKKNELFYLH